MSELEPVKLCSECRERPAKTKGLCGRCYLRAWRGPSQHSQQPKTHCKHGHELTPENTILRADGRLCRTCQRAAERESQRRRRAANPRPKLPPQIKSEIIRQGVLKSWQVDPDPEWVTVQEAALELGVAECAIRSAIQRGDLRSCKVGRRRLIERTDLDGYAAKVRKK